MSFYQFAQSILPSVRDPQKSLTIKDKLIWTAIVLVIFFILGTIMLIGINQAQLPQLEYLQMILASQIGTLITLGIGPIVLASIVLQLLVGVKIINLDFSKPDDRAKFSVLQKLSSIALAIIEAIVSVKIGFLTPQPGFGFFVVLQVVIGALIILYLDEVVSKYGIGSGIGLFIAAGVSQTIIWRIFAPPIAGSAGGLIFMAVSLISTGAMIQLLTLVIIPLLITVLVFLIVVYVEGMHVNIPLTVGRSGMGAKYPVKLLYVSVTPVIFASALFANLNLLLNLAKNTRLENILFKIGAVLSPQHNLIGNAILGGATSGMWINALIYMVLFILTCVIFGKFWVMVGGQDASSVARQLQSSGMSIPGFRRDERVLSTVLNRYIPTITILGSIFVGFLAFISDLTGAIGSGTGILLTAGVIYKIYEVLAKDQVFQNSALLKQMAGRK